MTHSRTIESYSISTIKPDKRPAIWVTYRDVNAMFPVCYLQKPKHLSEKQWENVLKHIKFDAPVNVLEEE